MLDLSGTHRVRMLIKSAPAPSGRGTVDEQLIKSDTCFFNVMLPAYSSLEIMQKRMQICIDIEAGMDGDEVSANEVASVEAVPGAVVDVEAAAESAAAALGAGDEDAAESDEAAAEAESLGDFYA